MGYKYFHTFITTTNFFQAIHEYKKYKKKYFSEEDRIMVAIIRLQAERSDNLQRICVTSVVSLQSLATSSSSSPPLVRLASCGNLNEPQEDALMLIRAKLTSDTMTSRALIARWRHPRNDWWHLWEFRMLRILHLQQGQKLVSYSSHWRDGALIFISVPCVTEPYLVRPLRCCHHHRVWGKFERH